MAKQPIELSPYSASWPHEFAKEKAALLNLTGAWVEAIEHIGSTAIPGLAAKPVIDILIGVRNLKEADEHCIFAIQTLGYDYIQKFEVELPNRRYFQKTSLQGKKTHQIHLVEINTDIWKRHLLFRDYLRSHPAAAQEYEDLKKSLASIHSNTWDYADAKTTFIRNIEDKARLESH